MYHFRKAESSDSIALTELAIFSEAHWGYDKEFLDQFYDLYKVSEEYIENNPVYILYSDEENIGFFGLLPSDDVAILEHLFISPRFIGKGFGKMIWDYMLQVCKKLEISEIEFVTSPQAKDFYLKQGASFIEEVDSLVIKNRKVPKFAYRLQE